MKSAIVVGAGLAGLTAAYRLKKGDWQVKVLESTERIAGRVSTCKHQNYLIDDGPTAVSTSYVSYIEMLHELKLGSAIIESSNVIGFYRKGTIHEIDGRHPIRSFVSTNFMTWGERFQLAWGGLRLMKDMRGAKLSNVIGFERFDIETIDTYLRRLYSGTLVDEILDLVVHCFTYGDKCEASVVEMFAGLDSASGKLINVLGGLDLLPRTLASHVDVRLRSPVTSVRKSGRQLQVEYADGADGGALKMETVDACVITTTFQQAAGLYPPLKQEAPAFYAQDKIAQTFAVYLGYTRQTNSNAIALSLPQRDFPLVPAIFLDHNKAPDRAPLGHSLLTVYFAASATHKLKTWTEPQLIDEAQRIATQLFPELAGSCDMHLVRYFDRASHLVPVGHFKALRELIDRHSKDDPVQLAGDYFSVPSQETAVAWGWCAADNLMQQK